MIEQVPEPETFPAGRATPRSTVAAVAVAGAAGLAYAALVNPKSGGYPPCVFHAATGLWCPGCGGARALHALLNGQVLTALHANALTMFTLPFLFAGVVIWASRSTSRPIRFPRIPAAAVWSFVIVVAVFSVLRNIPAHPFDLLAPG